MRTQYDIAIIGGGIMGCATALRLAESGMRPIIIEQNDLAQGASGVNAGTLSLQIKRVKLMPYALRGYEEWKKMGDAVGFHALGGYTLAFTDEEAGLLHARQTLKKKAGAPINFLSRQAVCDAEPNLSRKVKLASYCKLDGYANSSLTGRYYRLCLNEKTIPFLEHSAVQSICLIPEGFSLKLPHKTVTATRILLATGAWLKPVAAMLNVNLPVRARINSVSVTERMPPITSSILGHATGLLTMKQKENGTILIGGGWQGRGSPQTGRGEVLCDSIKSNIALAQYTLPALTNARIVRSWTGFEANVPDYFPLAGRLPGVKNAFVLGCVRGGFTIGPYIGKLMGDFILEKEPELPLFDPNRFFKKDIIQ